MAGINFIKQIEEKIKMQEASSGGGRAKFSFNMGALESLTNYQKVRLGIIFLGILANVFYSDLLQNFYIKDLMAIARSEEAELNQDIQRSTAEKQKNVVLQNQIQEYERDMQELRGKINSINQIRNTNRNLVLRMSDLIIAELPREIWLQSLNIKTQDNTGSIEMTARSVDLRVIGNYVDRLERNAFFPKWTLGPTTTTRENVGEGDAAGSREVTSFNLKANLVGMP